MWWCNGQPFIGVLEHFLLVSLFVCDWIIYILRFGDILKMLTICMVPMLAEQAFELPSLVLELPYEMK